MKKATLWTIQTSNTAETFPVRLYLDRASAEVSLHEHFTDYWIQAGWAKVVEVEAVSYFEE